MKAAIYARKSTDDSDKHEDNRSVSRQIERAREFCNVRGWTVSEDHIYADDGISGAEYQNRPGVLSLMANLKNCDVVVMSEISRLGRDMVRNAVLIDEIRSSNVQIWYYLTNEQEHADTPEQRIMVTLRSFAAEVERAKNAQRTRDALERKALRGQNAGGRVYGYRNVWIMEDGRRVVAPAGAKRPEAVNHTEYEIDPQEAEVLNSIFRAYAAGHGMRTIAQALNGDPEHHDVAQRFFGGCTPSSPFKGTQSWAPTSIREMLYRERYRGKIPYGQFRKAYRGGTKTRIQQEQFHMIDAPLLRIIDETLWTTVHQRLRLARDAYISSRAGKQLVNQTDTGRASKYLLSGLMRCGCCGGPMVASSTPHGSRGKRWQVPIYRCSYRHNRGTTVCENDRRTLTSDVDARVIGALEAQFLNPAAIDYVVDLVIDAVVEARRAAPDQLKRIETEIRRLKRELDRFVSLIASGQAPQRVLEEITARERQVRDLELERERLEAAVPKPSEMERIRQFAHERMKRIRDTLQNDVPGAREALKQILDGPITFKLDGSDYKIEGKTRVGALFTQDPTVTCIKLASPRGLDLIPQLSISSQVIALYYKHHQSR